MLSTVVRRHDTALGRPDNAQRVHVEPAGKPGATSGFNRTPSASLTGPRSVKDKTWMSRLLHRDITPLRQNGCSTLLQHRNEVRGNPLAEKPAGLQLAEMD